MIVLAIGIVFFGRFLSAFHLRLFLLVFALAPTLVVFGGCLLWWFDCHLAAAVGCQPGSKELLALFGFMSFHVLVHTELVWVIGFFGLAEEVLRVC